jgi:hypothetical protein
LPVGEVSRKFRLDYFSATPVDGGLQPPAARRWDFRIGAPKDEAWLIDEGLAASVPDGTTLAGRLREPESFAMSGGVMVPVGAEMLTSANFSKRLSNLIESLCFY